MADAKPELLDEVEAFKKRRTHLLRKITRHCKEISRLIDKQKSRRAMRILLKVCYEAYQEAESINEKILDSLDEEDEEALKQASLHDKYYLQIDEASEAIISYAALFSYNASQTTTDDDEIARVSRAQSVASCLTKDDREKSADLGELNDALSQISEQISQTVAKSIENALAKTKAVKKPKVKVIEAVRPTPRNRNSQWLDGQDEDIEATDSWIDLYVGGNDSFSQSSSECSRHNSAAILEPYSGSSLEWFQCLDLFKSLVHNNRTSPGEKLAILRRSLRGDCDDIVYGLGCGESAYKAALSRLKDNCGRRDVMRAAHIHAIEKIEVGKTSTTLKRFAERVRTHLFDLSRIGGSSQRDIIERVNAKLSIQDRLAWNEGCTSGAFFNDLERYGAWLCSRAASYQNSYDIATEQNKTHNETEKRVKGRSYNVTAEPSKAQKSSGCWNCGSDHRLEGCSKFLAMPISDRFKFAEEKRLCYTCLRGTHASKDCRTSKECGPKTPSQPFAPKVTVNATSVHTSKTCKEAVALGVMSVQVVDAQGWRLTANLLIDEGSNSNLIQSAFLKRLGFSGKRVKLRLSGVGGKKSSHSSEHTQIQIEGEKCFIAIFARSVPKICEPTEKIEWVRLKQNWTHLKDLPLLDSGGDIHILIGSNLSHLLTPIESRRGQEGEPGAIRTDFGWVARGVIDPDGDQTSRVNLIQRVYSEMNDSFRRFCETESFGTEHSSGPALTKEDSRAVQMVKQGTKRLDQGYQVALPWREGESALKNNREMGEQRFKALQRKFSAR